MIKSVMFGLRVLFFMKCLQSITSQDQKKNFVLFTKKSKKENFL